MSSLQVNDSGRRGRSRSPSGRERSSSRIERSPAGRDRDRVEPTIITAAPYPSDDDTGNILDDTRRSARIPEYDDYRGGIVSPPSPGPLPSSDARYRSSKYANVDVNYGDERREKVYRAESKSQGSYERTYEREKKRTEKVSTDKGNGKISTVIAEDKFAFLPAKYAQKADSGTSRTKSHARNQSSVGYYDEQAKTSQSSQSLGTWPGEHDTGRAPHRSKRRSSVSDESDETDEDIEDLAYGHDSFAPSKSVDKPMYGSSPGNGRYAATFADEKGYGREPQIINVGPRESKDAKDPRSSRGSFDSRGVDDSRGSRHSRVPSDLRDDRRVYEDVRSTTRESKKYYRDDPRSSSHADPRSSSRLDPRSSSSNVLSVEPERRRERSRSPMPTKGMERLSVNTLSVGGPHYAGGSLSAAPGSPMQEAYHGTYQSMSPMPSPLMLASRGTSDVQLMDINGPELETEGAVARVPGGEAAEKMRRRARFYDPEEDAQRLAKALHGERRAPDTGPLIEILPGLTHDQVMELRAAYKRIVKTGPERKGVNIAKHIRARLKDDDPAVMKVCYATALGRWESEAYWANFWYHGNKTRRELLIESLMGRTNDEIHHIKKSFSDKKYADSLTKCMRTELKEDKFKRAVLFVLDERRMEEVGRDGRLLPVDRKLVDEDAVALRRSVLAEKGGETAMIDIVVQRSDTHLREVLRAYNAQYQSNFARDCLKKSGNLVGEMLAHILNGVINKPVRDALLVHHALTTSKRDELRRELLISRLVRFHWDGNHMAAIKAAYRSRYNRDMQEAIRDATGNSDWGLFCRELCITRIPDDVKRVERIEIRHDDRH
ncbi:hypothetical protein SEPCBS119000_004827 [Sporothrix epigloea]|uniref:Annexin ANXC4 n=1 Tax=Sporothrix epigloea TaxID=1892477 RepID=A0ABP0DU92_9PEZI